MKKASSFYLVLVIMFFFASAFVLEEGWNIPEKYNTMKNPYVDDDDSDDIGADLWSEHCASCHGKTGVGDGKKAGELETEMEDFSEDEVQDQSDGVLYYKSYIGKDEMPNFEKKITDDEERWLLINYIRALAE